MYYLRLYKNSEDYLNEIESLTGKTICFCEDKNKILYGYKNKYKLFKKESDIEFFTENASLFTPITKEKLSYIGKAQDGSVWFETIETKNNKTNISTNYAIYPYSNVNDILEENKLMVNIPISQDYCNIAIVGDTEVSGFSTSSSTIVSSTINAETFEFPFRNICSWFVFKLYSTNYKKIKTLELSSINGEKLAGVGICTHTYGKLPSFTLGENSSNKVILNCGDGVELSTSSTEPTQFGFCVAPVLLTGGFSLKIITVDGEEIIKTSTKERNLERNTFLNMSAFSI